MIENMAPVLTRLFTPLFAAVLVAFLGTLLWTGRGVDIERNMLIAFDLLLVLVLGPAALLRLRPRSTSAPPGAFDVLQVVLVVSALLADAVALWAIAARITEFGFSPNRVAALGDERDPPGQPGVVRRALRPLPARRARSRASNGGRRITCRSMPCGRRSS